MRRKAKPEHFKCLMEVVTMQEAARLFNVRPETVRDAIDRNRVAAVRCGRIWLVSVASCRDQWRKN